MRERPAPLLFAPTRALRRGSALRVIAPSGPFDRAALERGLSHLSRHFELRVDARIFSRQGYLAGDDASRLEALHQALAEADTCALWAARGGYGAMRLLDRLPVDMVRRAGKGLIGFSDVTALHALWARAGLRSVHGPMLSWLGAREASVSDSAVEALLGGAPALEELEVLRPGVAEGPLVGGNLTVLCSLLGTPHFPPVDGAILFLEDVNERPYRVDRALTQLALAGVFRRVAGVALGSFTGCLPGPDGVSVEEVLAERFGRRSGGLGELSSGLGVPVVAGLPAGHGERNLPLPLGAPARLDADGATLSFL